MEKRLWTREEEIIVFNLYCKIPFQKSSKFNPDVIKIANLIGRSPSAVNMKIGNFGRMDPELRKKNITGLTNGSKLDEEIWDEFHNNWDKLAYESENLIEKMIDNTKIEREDLVEGYDREITTRTRVNQKFFRDAVLSAYGCCCVTGISTSALLIASHIKPWRDSSPDEKTNPQNGICLNALHDKAFDRGLITVTPNYRIYISKDISDIYEGKIVKEYFGRYNGRKIMIPEKFCPDKVFLEYHNDVVFRK